MHANVPKFSPAGPALHFLASENNLYDYSNLYGFARLFLDQVKELSFSEKQPLLILSDSSDELIFVLASCYLLNIPVLPLHADTTPRELEKLLELISPAAIFTDRPERFPPLISVPQISVPQDSLLAEGEWIQEIFSLDHPATAAGLFLTSGSTGAGKIVPLKRRQILYAAHASAANFKPDKNRYWLLCLPVNHVGGMMIVLRSLLYHSAIYRMPGFNPDQVQVFLSENKLFQVASLVPTMLVRLLENPLFQAHREFKAVLVGGGPISLQLIEDSLIRGIPLVTSYGMTETCAQISANPMLKPSGFYAPKTSMGKIFQPNEIEIRDEKGDKVRVNESGQIWLKGPQIFDGYLSNKIPGESVFDENGWFNTGDFGHLNRHHQIFIESRRTDLIITGGENVNPADVEAALNSMENISESAVTGIPDDQWGQRVVAFIVPHQDKPDLKELNQTLKNLLRGFQIPKKFIFVDEIPKTALGKIKRAELPALYKTVQSKL